MLLYPRSRQPTVVVLGVDGYGWSYLFGVATALLTATFVWGVVHLITRGREKWWAAALQTLTAGLLLIVSVPAVPIMLLGGALSFKNSYRHVGTVDGREIVVQQFAGWRGADDLDAGYRDGPLVSFTAHNDTYLHRTFTDISTWKFSVTTTASTVDVHYRSSDTPAQTGTLTLTRLQPENNALHQAAS